MFSVRLASEPIPPKHTPHTSCSALGLMKICPQRPWIFKPSGVVLPWVGARRLSRRAGRRAFDDRAGGLQHVPSCPVLQNMGWCRMRFFDRCCTLKACFSGDLKRFSYLWFLVWHRSCAPQMARIDFSLRDGSHQFARSSRPDASMFDFMGRLGKVNC